MNSIPEKDSESAVRKTQNPKWKGFVVEELGDVLEELSDEEAATIQGGVRTQRASRGGIYVWPAISSSSDISGLSIPHSASSDISRLSIPRSARSQVTSGDLVFFYPSMHHSGVYLSAGGILSTLA